MSSFNRVEDLDVYNKLCDLDQATYESVRARYEECIRMLNGLERSLERHLPEEDRRFLDRPRPSDSEP